MFANPNQFQAYQNVKVVRFLIDLDLNLTSQAMLTKILTKTSTGVEVKNHLMICQNPPSPLMETGQLQRITKTSKSWSELDLHYLENLKLHTFYPQYLLSNYPSSHCS